MSVSPILATLKRNKFGAVLIAVQMAVTLAFISNSFALIEQRLAWSSRPTGLDEANVFVVRSASAADGGDFLAREMTDLQALRSLPGVADAYVTNDYPLQGGGWTNSVKLSPTQKSGIKAAYYFGDEHALSTLGVRLTAGRNFTAGEVLTTGLEEPGKSSGYIITQALSDKLFPHGDALGKRIYVEDDSFAAPIIGIVERLQGPFYAATGPQSTYPENTVMTPRRPVSAFPRYLVRTLPGRQAEVMQKAERTLLALDGERTLKLLSMSDQRAIAYRGNHGLVVLLVSVCVALLVVTSFGIVGLTSYWVTLRRQQIGIRRALGATRLNILQYFQTENLLIAVAGAGSGVVLAILLNVWMVSEFSMVRMADSRALGGAVLLLLLGQAAVIWPALRAASIPPALASRGG
jgi:putative ABC transport system permease protein